MYRKYNSVCILEIKGKVSLSIVPDVSADSLEHEIVKKVRRGLLSIPINGRV